MHIELSHPEMEENETRRLRSELLRNMSDEDAARVCVRCGCVFWPRGGRIACPFCGTVHVPHVG